MAVNPDEILVAKESFAAPGTHVAAGELVRRGDPIVAGREHLFTPLAASVRASVPGVPVSPPPFLAPEQGGDTGTEPAEDEPAKPKRTGKATAGD